MFGDTESYLDKFRTCVRARPFGMQKLDKEFYVKEPSKPLFKNQNLLTVHNLYRYRCLNELFKIIKYKAPKPMISIFNLSNQNENRFITPNPSNNFAYKASWLWNYFRKSLDSPSKCSFSEEESLIKCLLKKSILYAQNSNEDDWHSDNFTKFDSL